MSTETLLTFDDFLDRVDVHVSALSKNVKRTPPREWGISDNGNHAAISIYQYPTSLSDRPSIGLTQHTTRRGQRIKKDAGPSVFCTEQGAMKAAQEILTWFNSKDCQL
jgi:predicted KAP-like P-loop ATPase